MIPDGAQAAVLFRLCIGTALLLCSIWAAAGGADSDDRRVILNSGKLSIAFGVSGNRLALVGLCRPGGPEWLGAARGTDELWRLTFRGPKGAVKEIGSSEVALSGVTQRPDKLTFAWNTPLDGETAVVGVTVRCPKDSSLSYWSLQAELPDGWILTRADFPVIPNIELRKARHLAVPWGWGLEYDVKPGLTYHATYPSCQATMQFVALYGGRQGLYIAAHDAQGNMKEFDVSAGENGVRYACTNWPALPGKTGGSYEVPFEAAIGLFGGGYYEAARIYREFTFSTPWGSGGPLSKRKIPQWLRDTEVWLMADGDSLSDLALYRQAAGFFGVRCSLHWYNWHQIPSEAYAPAFLPAKPHFVEKLKAFRSEGLHAMPYINARLCDPKSQFWTDVRADLSAVRQEDGQAYAEDYGAQAVPDVMCPYAPRWMDTMLDLVERMVNECGVESVYIDQIGAAAAVRCFSRDHGHPPGGGRLWVDGYRKLLAEARKRLPADGILTTEENAECWTDQLDALLMVNTPSTQARVIPLFPAVYSGRAINFGFQYIVYEDDFQRSLPFRAKQAQAFVWGSQLGWVGPGSLLQAAPEAEFLRNLARCRHYAHKFVMGGRFLGMLDARGDNPVLSGQGTAFFGGSLYEISLHAVLASGWLAEDGSLGVLLVNMSDGPHEVKVKLPLRAAGIGTSGGHSMTIHGPEGLVSSRETTSQTQTVEVPPRSALLLSLTHKESSGTS